MLKNYKGILLFAKIHKDNDLYIKFLSNTDELITGIVYGGLSKNKRNILQIGFFLNFQVSIKVNKPASINAELSEPFISTIINDRYKLNCLLSVASLINLSIIEGQKVKNIYKISHNFLITMFVNRRWFHEYCIFLFQLLKIIGYEIDYKKNNNKKFFDITKLQFNLDKSYTTIEFPHNLLNKKNLKIELISVNLVFRIFEEVFVKNHLSNFNLRLPNHYHLFKKLIIENIKYK